MDFGSIFSTVKEGIIERVKLADESENSASSPETERSNLGYSREESEISDDHAAGDIPNLENDSASNEEELLAAVENGDISTFMDMLNRKRELNLDINHVNANGQSAIRLATTHGYSGIVEQLLIHGARAGDALLRAVDVGFVETVTKICSHALELEIPDDRTAILDCHSEDDAYHADITPMILAAQRNDFAIVQVLRDSGCKIKAIASNKKADSSLATDDLQKSVGTLEVYKGLASEAYLIQVNEDPVDVAFTLSKQLYDVGQKDVEFKPSFTELADSVDRTATKLISYARNTVEILSILTQPEVQAKTEVGESSTVGPLPKISRAIDFNQKHFVAHPNCQQAIVAKFYGRLAFLRDRSTVVRFSFFIMMILGYPFLSLLYLYVPTNRIRRFVGCPYSKFLLKLASDVFLVVLVIADTILNDTAISDDFPLKKATKVLLLFWIIGMAWREIKNIYTYNIAVLSQSNHLRDIVLVILFLVGISLEITSYYSNEDISTDITSETRRDTSLMLPDTYGGVNRLHDRNSDYFQEPVMLHRVPRAPRVRGSNTNTDDKRVDYGINQGSDFLYYNWWHPKLISTTLFAMATVIAVLRMLSYLVVSDVLGPLQISISSMLTNTGHFFLLMAAVMIAFGVGLTYIYAYYSRIKSLTCAEDSNIGCDSGKFNNLFFTIVFLYWTALGLADKNELQLDNQAQVLEVAGFVLYAVFFVVLVIVMLNAIIAVMSEVYNSIEENADLEWKFHSTVMWMGILCDDDVVPPPFNLLPSYETVRHLVMKILRKICGPKCCSFDPDTRNKKISNGGNGVTKQDSQDGNTQYKRVINKLIDRYVLAKTADEANVNADVSFTDILGLRHDLQNLKIEMFLRLYETRDDIGKTTAKATTTQNMSTRAKSVLQKVEHIHEGMDSMWLDSMRTFKTTVEERRDLLTMKNGILTQLTTTYATAKSRIGEGYESARSLITCDIPSDPHTADS